MKNKSDEVVNCIKLKLRDVASPYYISGHALHYLRLDQLNEFCEDICLRLVTSMVTENLETKSRTVKIFKPITVSDDVMVSNPSSWWQMFKRDFCPKWFVKMFPIKYKDERIKHTHLTWVRVEFVARSEVFAAYPKLPKIYERCEEPIIYHTFGHFNLNYEENIDVSDIKGEADCNIWFEIDGKIIGDDRR